MAKTHHVGNENLTDKPRDGMRIQTTVVQIQTTVVHRWLQAAGGFVSTVSPVSRHDLTDAQWAVLVPRHVCPPTVG
jgi:hypothetical protein